jgi:hypothetical protein
MAKEGTTKGKKVTYEGREYVVTKFSEEFICVEQCGSPPVRWSYSPKTEQFRKFNSHAVADGELQGSLLAVLAEAGLQKKECCGACNGACGK